MTFNKISAPSVREIFVRQIENKILSGELKPGDKLPPARELCTIMGVSLTVVNAGISELASKGFVEVKPRHGTYVADYIANGNTETFFSIIRYNGGKINAHEFRSFTESRVALDALIVELVIKRASDEEIAQLGEILDEVKKPHGLHETCTLITDFIIRCILSVRTRSVRSCIIQLSSRRRACMRCSSRKTAFRSLSTTWRPCTNA